MWVRVPPWELAVVGEFGRAGYPSRGRVVPYRHGLPPTTARFRQPKEYVLVGGFASVVADTKQYLTTHRRTIPTGYPTIDKALRGGGSPGQAVWLFARTEVGKSVIATNMAVNAVLAGHGAGIVSMEMTAHEVTLRCLSVYLGVGTDEVETLLKDNQFNPMMSDALKALKGLTIIDPSAPSWDDLRAWVKETRQSGQQLDRVVLDHLKLMTRKGMYSRGETERIGQLAEDAKRFAKDADVELVVIHQAGRSLEGTSGQKNHGDTPLTMEDLMYGGEQDADVILGLFRPEKNPDLSAGERSLVAGRIYMQVLKNRNGPVIYEGVECSWLKPSLKVVERANSH